MSLLSLKALEFSSLAFLGAGNVEREMGEIACPQGALSVTDLSTGPPQGPWLVQL